MSFSTKRDIRMAVRKAIAQLSPNEKSEQSAQIFSHIDSLECIKQAKTIALFASLHDEPQTADSIERISRVKRVVLPRIEGDEMEFYDMSEGVAQGAFGILEPQTRNPIRPSEIDVMIVPGVVFTRSGARCGRGKGFYDKYISREGFRAITIGVCYPCQIVESLPTEPHDKIMDMVVEQ